MDSRGRALPASAIAFRGWLELFLYAGRARSACVRNRALGRVLRSALLALNTNALYLQCDLIETETEGVRVAWRALLVFSNGAVPAEADWGAVGGGAGIAAGEGTTLTAVGWMADVPVRVCFRDLLSS